jgi:hypothetical protein
MIIIQKADIKDNNITYQKSTKIHQNRGSHLKITLSDLNGKLIVKQEIMHTNSGIVTIRI